MKSVGESLGKFIRRSRRQAKSYESQNMWLIFSDKP
jgi:hypothetical protein